MRERKKRIWTNAEIQSAEEATTLTAELHGLYCPACKSRNCAKNGKENGNQRYRCSKCGKHFRNTTGNTIHHLHLKPKVQDYIECMNQGLSLRKTADKLEISLQTAFRWRHRFLTAMRKKPEQQKCGTRTVSAFTIPYSAKGKPEPETKKPDITSLLQIDIAGRTTINVLGQYGYSATMLTEKIKEPAKHVASSAIPRLCKQKMAKCKSNDQINQTERIQSQIHHWLGIFRGVATKYLENYWAWFALIRQLQFRATEKTQYMHQCF